MNPVHTRLRSILVVSAALMALARGSDALASATATLDLEGLSTRADHIVVGQVELMDSHFLAPGSQRIVTDATLVTERNVLGASTGSRFVVRRLGGEVGKVGQLVYSEASYFVGERVLLFAAERQGAFFAVGMAQGAVPIGDDEAGVTRVQHTPTLPAGVVTGRRVDDVLDEVRASLDRNARK